MRCSRCTNVYIVIDYLRLGSFEHKMAKINFNRGSVDRSVDMDFDDSERVNEFTHYLDYDHSVNNDLK